MPHSSGGGSHGGGCHGGSHGSHGGNSGPRISRRPYRNARRFYYYDRHGLQHYVYCTSKPKRQNIGGFIVSVIFMLPFLFIGVFFLSLVADLFKPPEKISMHYVDSGSHISDSIGVIDNEHDLEDTLVSFDKLTGIKPYIITVYDSRWMGKYSSLEDYAYNLYVNNFSDERHFLIVYSEPENAASLDFVDWSWEGMQGDDTDPVLTTGNFGRFQNDLQNNLTKDNVSVGEALNIAFGNSLEYMMKGGSDIEGIILTILFVIFWDGISILSFVSIIKSFIQSRRKYTEAPSERSKLLSSKNDCAWGNDYDKGNN